MEQVLEMTSVSHLDDDFAAAKGESCCVIHIQMLFKSFAPHLHVKLKIWSQVTCILMRGTAFTGVRVDMHLALDLPTQR